MLYRFFVGPMKTVTIFPFAAALLFLLVHMYTADHSYWKTVNINVAVVLIETRSRGT
jgi:hypothetical protein